MLRRSESRGPLSPHSQRLAIAVAVILLSPWLQIASAAAQQPDHHGQRQSGSIQYDNHGRSHGGQPRAYAVEDTPLSQADISVVESVEPVEPAQETPYALHHEMKQSPSSPKHPQHARDNDDTMIINDSDRADNARRRNGPVNNKYTPQPEKNPIPSDASALATLAPAQPVRAPNPPRHLRPRSSGLASPHVARSLEDWEVEDFVLLATVDGDLYASDRKTGTERWRLEVDQPMVETKHHRSNTSVLDDDYNPIDHYIWAVEPNRDGGLYVWIPDSGGGLVRTSFTMKRLVEELAPFADEDPPVVYTGDKKTTLITLDAATGRVLKWFGSSGSHINEAESCLRPETLYNMDSTECSSTGSITLGRTEYTVGIQRRDGRPIATLKYAEWGPNNYDNDLYHQYHASLDNRYITSQHDGKVYAFDYDHARKASPKFSQKFSAPVARVFDVCRPWGAPRDSSPELVVLPQPPMPSHDTDVARIRSNSIFLNQTKAGNWYAMSGRAYPLIIDAPMAKSAHPDWLVDSMPPADGLVGTHYLEALGHSEKQQPALLPAGPTHDGHDEAENDSYLGIIVPDSVHEVGIVDKVKTLPQSVANSLVDFVSNPMLIITIIITLIVNEKKLRRTYQRLKVGQHLRTSFTQAKEDQASISEPEDDAQKADTATDDKAAAGGVRPDDRSQPENAVREKEAEPQVAEKSTQPEEKSLEQQQLGVAETKEADAAVPNGASPEKKKKAHRGRRGGVKHRKGKARELSQSQGDSASTKADNDPVNTAMKLGGEQRNAGVEPNVITVQPNDMQAVGEPIVRMGNIEVNTEEQLGTGSNGTLVFAGKFDGRDVAVKRMLIHFYDIASQETRLLRESDDHPNVIRYYSQQSQDGFLYIALERCAASLAEIIEKPHLHRELANAGRMDLPAVLYQITNGISHLHSLRIVHRDLKPQNILVNMGKDGKPRLLVSDFGLCKKLEDTQSSFGATTGRAAGTSGWRAPELLLDDDGDGPRDPALLDLDTNNSGSGSVLVHDAMTNSRRATRSIDIFSLGLVFFYVLTNGLHPFDCGDRYMREVNIRNGKFNLKPLDALGDFAYEARDLIDSMLRREPKHRPTATEIMSHPFFWSAKKRLAFLCDVSDHFEKEPRDPPSPALQELERHAPQVTRGDFLRTLPRDFVDSLGKQRKYVGSRLLDLLRALRNKRNHYEDMPETLKRTVGPLPDGYLSFWTTKFPNLLLVCWNVVYEVRWDEADRFREYYQPAAL